MKRILLLFRSSQSCIAIKNIYPHGRLGHHDDRAGSGIVDLKMLLYLASQTKSLLLNFNLVFIFLLLQLFLIFSRFSCTVLRD